MGINLCVAHTPPDDLLFLGKLVGLPHPINRFCVFNLYRHQLTEHPLLHKGNVGTVATPLRPAEGSTPITCSDRSVSVVCTNDLALTRGTITASCAKLVSVICENLLVLNGITTTVLCDKLVSVVSKNDFALNGGAIINSCAKLVSVVYENVICVNVGATTFPCNKLVSVVCKNVIGVNGI